MTFVAIALATALGTGYVPFAPGTFGSLAGLLLWWLLPSGTIVQLAAIAIVFAAGAWSGSIAERHFNRTDPGPVVIDEVLGMLVTLFLNPVGWVGAAIGFLLFRVADIVKPFPANRLEALHGDRQGQHSIRVNDQWRICFVWRDNEAWEVEIVDYH